MIGLRNLGKRQRIAGAIAAAVLVVGGAGLLVLRDDDDTGTPDPGNPVEQTTTTANTRDSEDPGTTTTPTPAVPLADVTLSAVEIGQFDAPISVVSRTSDRDLYVVERGGRVVRVRVEGVGSDKTYTPDGEPIVDISDQVTTEGERGLLDAEFSPDGSRLFLSYSQVPDGTSTIVSYDYVDGTTVDVESRREILTVEDFASNHNGGGIEFGPDGYLWFALGDGGGAGDPQQTAQDTERLLGKLIRIDPLGAAGDEPYAIPADNPFADGSGGRPEIWLYGVRNPWRFSFDPATDDLWIGDVGQNAWEEIDFLPASTDMGRGANLGWSLMEASHPFAGGSNPPGGVLPIFEYPTGDACAVTGGLVYRGTVNAALGGAYVFGDFCEPHLRAIRQSNGQVVDERTFDLEVPGLVSFGVDTDGEIYAVSLDGGVFRLDP